MRNSILFFFLIVLSLELLFVLDPILCPVGSGWCSVGLIITMTPMILFVGVMTLTILNALKVNIYELTLKRLGVKPKWTYYFLSLLVALILVYFTLIGKFD